MTEREERWSYPDGRVRDHVHSTIQIHSYAFKSCGNSSFWWNGECSVCAFSLCSIKNHFAVLTGEFRVWSPPLSCINRGSGIWIAIAQGSTLSVNVVLGIHILLLREIRTKESEIACSCSERCNRV